MASLLFIYIEYIYFLPRNALVQNSRVFTVAIVWLSSGYRVATEWLSSGYRVMASRRPPSQPRFVLPTKKMGKGQEYKDELAGIV